MPRSRQQVDWATLSRRYTALIRGINVGRAKRVAMADLRKLVSDLGFDDVRTLLNSGNLLFAATGRSTPSGVAPRIEQGMIERLGVAARVTVLTAEELARAATENPLLDAARDPKRLLVAFLADPQDRPRLEPLLEQDWRPEELALGPRVAYLWCPEGTLASRLPAAIGRVLGDAVTTRNWSTVTKLHALTQQSRSG